MAIKVIVPNKNYNAVYFGVQFSNGVAVFEDEAKGREIAERLGYKVEPVEDAVEAEVPVEDAVEVAEEPVAPKPKRTRRKKAGADE